MSDERQVDVAELRELGEWMYRRREKHKWTRERNEHVSRRVLLAADELERLRAENGRYQEWWQADEDAREESRARVAELEREKAATQKLAGWISDTTPADTENAAEKLAIVYRKAAALDKLEAARARLRGSMAINHDEADGIRIDIEYGDDTRVLVYGAKSVLDALSSLPSPEQESEPEKSP